MYMVHTHYKWIKKQQQQQKPTTAFKIKFKLFTKIDKDPVWPLSILGSSPSLPRAC